MKSYFWLKYAISELSYHIPSVTVKNSFLARESDHFTDRDRERDLMYFNFVSEY